MNLLNYKSQRKMEDYREKFKIQVKVKETIQSVGLFSQRDYSVSGTFVHYSESETIQWDYFILLLLQRFPIHRHF